MDSKYWFFSGLGIVNSDFYMVRGKNMLILSCFKTKTMIFNVPGTENIDF